MRDEKVILNEELYLWYIVLPALQPIEYHLGPLFIHFESWDHDFSKSYILKKVIFSALLKGAAKNFMLQKYKEVGLSWDLCKICSTATVPVKESFLLKGKFTRQGKSHLLIVWLI
jgi:hypothetical protein